MRYNFLLFAILILSIKTIIKAENDVNAECGLIRVKRSVALSFNVCVKCALTFARKCQLSVWKMLNVKWLIVDRDAHA